MSKKSNTEYVKVAENARQTWTIKISSIDAVGPVQRRMFPSEQVEFYFPVVCNGETFIIEHEDKEVIKRWQSELVQAWIAVL